MRSLVLIFLMLLLMGCKESPKPLSDPRQSKEIIVVTHNGPSTYYYSGSNQYAGLEYDLVRNFVKELGPEYSVKFLVVGNISQVIPALVKQKAHFAAADLSVTRMREHMVQFTQPYHTVQQQIVFNSEQTKAPASVKDLIGKQILIPAGTSYAERLQQLKEKEPRLHWSETPKANSDELLARVAEGELDYTVADGHLIALVQNYYPNLGARMPLGKPEQVAWAFAKTSDKWLYDKANAYFDRIKKDGTLRNLIDRYYGHADRLKPVDVTSFMQRSESLLPQYRPIFHEAQELTGLDWRLIAAIGYQESHWDRFNTSPTNVRGIMMLTEDTADRLGVTDRLDARQSIIAGARYVLMLKDLIPDSVHEPDRTWMALAAYNIGYAHLQDARILATRLKLNPDRWVDIKKTLPMLNKEEYYSTLKYGYARGGAPVVFVESVRTYHKILVKREPRHSPIFPSFEVAGLSGYGNNISQE
ncbi:membrane-bound lytic murein transglycosylase MltF [Methylobacillus gramineus]|uniref:membrane-bound lytic murein transglycosylase MltF n=1 Tax=Methylobacillus gramineus TaxID=755169 RepID=UPI001CFFF5AA|nr:membrane-bound lytic murein transglycosylase MltF [Methylobacillus gramineus]MCB5183981.1 membrane-bound lytic murein transglycosylase MltF [Methylobacillus gramineus]